ncbi:MAG TPA: hypothetical protein PKM48_10820 [Parvularculaceae bacterium]|nr:hypothetical protein [Parvularculaceae bacterium]
MIELAAALFLGASRTEVPPETWNCRNQVEVWCAADGCAATPPDESTPMDIWASLGASGEGEISACAYSGCWEGKAAMSSAAGRLLWIGDDLPFVSAIEGATGDVTLLILAEDGVGFIRVGGIATPLLCVRRLPFDDKAAGASVAPEGDAR